jgi:hypothetical protein
MTLLAAEAKWLSETRGTIGYQSEMKGEVPASQFLRLHLRGDSSDEFLELGEGSHHCDGDQLLIS